MDLFIQNTFPLMTGLQKIAIEKKSKRYLCSNIESKHWS